MLLFRKEGADVHLKTSPSDGNHGRLSLLRTFSVISLQWVLLRLLALCCCSTFSTVPVSCCVGAENIDHSIIANRTANACGLSAGWQDVLVSTSPPSFEQLVDRSREIRREDVRS